MRRGLALLLPALLSAGCATAPTRWAGRASVVLDTAPPGQSETGAGESAPDCGALDGSAPPVVGPPGPGGAEGPILWVTSISRAAPPAPGDAPPDRTEAALYEQIGSHTKTLAEFLAAVRPPKPLAEVIDLTRIPRTLTIAVHRQGYRPADRFERVQVIVKAVNFRFADPQPSETTFEVADLGHLTDQSQASGTAGVTASPNASAGVALSRSQTFDRDLRQRIQDEDVILAPRTLRVYREGAPGRDLTGALPLPITAEPLRPEATTSIRVITGVHLKDSAEAGGVDTAVLRYMGGTGAPVAPLFACARLRYLERRVIAGQRYLDEGRQTVEIAAGGTPWTPYEIVPAEEVRPPLWQVRASAEVVRIERDGENASEFLDLADAQKLRDALAGAAAKLGSWSARIGGRELSAVQRGALTVARVPDGPASRPAIDSALFEPARPPATPGRLE